METIEINYKLILRQDAIGDVYIMTDINDIHKPEIKIDEEDIDIVINSLRHFQQKRRDKKKE